MKRKIGFIGLGEMGFPMAKRLIDDGHKLIVFDIVKEPLLHLRDAGAEVAESAKEVTEKSEIVIVMVRTTAQAERVISGDKGVLEGATRGSTILLMSTIDPFAVKKLAGLAKEKGVDLLDAAVSGAKQGAEAGTLTVMVGGVEDAFRRCKPIFDVLGKNIFYLGDVGMGESAKLINNLLLLVNMSAAYEAVALGKKAGVKMDVLFNLLKVSTGNSWVIEHWDMVTSWKDNYKVGGTLDLIYKDINLTLDLGENLKVPLHLSSLAKQLVRY
jgi:3-hydroxyisobutyrate dehydrogenase-like beta-hydroxyacid dehydrogenase